MKIYPIYWITGQSGSGKTTLARALQEKLGGIVLDGDEMRESISLNASFSKEDRDDHNMRVARLAKVLSRQMMVIIAVIAPFQDTREKVDKLVSPTWIYIARNLSEHLDKPYEIPREPHVVLDSDSQDVDEEVQRVLAYIGKNT
ncbi:MAG: adenylyl-sulfate kinase [Candidatus Moraniibacteriota bacterium]